MIRNDGNVSYLSLGETIPPESPESPSRNQFLDHQIYGPRKELLVEVDVTQGPLVKRVERVDE